MEDDQQFCLRWNNHQSTIIQNFDTLLESGTLVDCTLAAEGKYLKAHKVVLSACSPYFEGLLSEHYDKHPVFILKDVKFKELKAMMDYMYRGEVNISQDQLTALLKAAESLQIKGLSDSRTDKGTGNTGNTTTGGSKDNTRPAKTASSTAAASASAAAVDIPHTSSGLTIEKNSKVPRQSIQQVSVSDQLENSASPQLRGHSSREGSQSPTRKRKRLRRRSLGNDDNSMENHEASNSSDVNMTAPALGVAPVAEEKSQADPADSIGRSALMQQLTKPADEMLQMPLEKPEPSEDMIQPKSEYQDDQESVEDLTNFDDDMNDLNEMEQDNSRAGPSHDPSQHAGMPSWHIAGDRSNASVVGAAAGPGAGDEVFLAAAEAAQAQRDSQVAFDIHSEFRGFTKIELQRTLAYLQKWDMLMSRHMAPNLPEIMPEFYLKKSHTRFLCTECPKEFTCKSDLWKHAQTKCGQHRKPNQLAMVKPDAPTEDFSTSVPEISTSNDKKPTTNGSKARRCRRRPVKYKVPSDSEIDQPFSFPRSTHSTRLRQSNSLNPKPIEDKKIKLVDLDLVQERKKFACDKCPKRFSAKQGLSQHTKYECRKEPRFECVYCPYKCNRPWVINEHLRREHSGKAMHYFDRDSET
ncbi:longitudinals lacking protein, isoforms A/B/D/L isoform X16 [Nasonia vitripennis]|uniref:Longitudinals lacking protein n=1 Tax=Nasonia vitripennis TaxID=7425 RepID=A0A7M7R0G2_NASVI|nr:longitudinals lacking protein, isoforms A/B/D/L isoform X16 [Nasonia vitripennis]XP_032456429.1 longitudinals lacking protein, isoforms A/B/D/L isoform X16 [Nasonia vitripennis]